MKEPPGDTHSDGSFIVYEREIGQKMGENARNARKPSKIQKKSERQFYQNHRADLKNNYNLDTMRNRHEKRYILGHFIINIFII